MMISLDSLPLFELLDEQNMVGFTGKITIVEKIDLHYVGTIYFLDGELISCIYNSSEGFKSFQRLVVDVVKLLPIKFILEPENVDVEEKNIHFPYSVLKNKTSELLHKLISSFEQRPPSHLKLMVRPEFIAEGDEIDHNEFQLLCDLSDWNLVSDVYAQSQLIDHEITMALVGLRKKGALLVKGPQE